MCRFFKVSDSRRTAALKLTADWISFVLSSCCSGELKINLVCVEEMEEYELGTVFKNICDFSQHDHGKQ